MEAVNRQSGLHSLINRDHYYHPPTSGSGHEQPHSYASAPMISPTTMYPPHPPPPYTHANSAPPHSLSGLVSPPASHPSESRRTSGDNKDQAQSHRQSLPSIKEALFAPSEYPPAPISIGPSPTRPYGHFSQQPPTPTSRTHQTDPTSFPSQINSTQHQRSSPPHPAHPPLSYPRADPAPPTSYETPRHPPLPSIRTALPSQSTSHLGYTSDYARNEHDTRGSAPVYNGYPQPPSHNGHHPGHSAGPPPTTSTFPPQSPQTAQRSYRARYDHSDERSKVADPPSTPKTYGPVVKRHLDYWDQEIDLNTIRNSGGEIARIASNSLDNAHRNTSHGAMPEKLTTQAEIDLIRAEYEKVGIALQRVSERMAAQGQHLGDQQAGSQSGKVADEYASEDLSWEEARAMGGFGSDAKKRRGRAAPPGRCHSCNRAETPEWRRGPDGARTLCNACGLHYAKLTRKMGSKQAQASGSALRPNSMGGVSPRS